MTSGCLAILVWSDSSELASLHVKKTFFFFVNTVEVPSSFIRCVLKCTVGPSTNVDDGTGNRLYIKTQPCFISSIQQAGMLYLGHNKSQ